MNDRGREGPKPSPPSEPYVRFSRIRLSSRGFLIGGVSRRARHDVLVEPAADEAEHATIADPLLGYLGDSLFNYLTVVRSHPALSFN